MVSGEKIIAIVGPTASGKTGLAIEVAKHVGGEIICADSRTIYTGMDIGTAKPSPDEMQGVRHHLLDILEPNQSYSAGEFKRDATKMVEQIQERDKIPIIVGGTGLYVSALLYDYRFPAGANNAVRGQLEGKSLEELQTILQAKDPEVYYDIDTKNKRRVIRAIETVGRPKTKREKLSPDYLLIGLSPEMEVLEERIRARTQTMLEAGLVHEVDGLVRKYGDAEPLRTVGYREVADMIRGKQSRDKTEELVILHTRQLAKRQMTWFKRNKDIVWFQSAEDAQNTFWV